MGKRLTAYVDCFLGFALKFRFVWRNLVNDGFRADNNATRCSALCQYKSMNISHNSEFLFYFLEWLSINPPLALDTRNELRSSDLSGLHVMQKWFSFLIILTNGPSPRFQ